MENGDEVFVVGGADLYAQAFDFADRLQLTDTGLGYSFVTYERL